MKNIYIKPSIELVNVEVESLLNSLSNLGGKTWDNKDYDTKLEIDNENGDNDDILCTKPDVPNIWDDEEW